MDHRDESDRPCTRHEPPARERMLELATIGSRSQSFHHDAASKLQSLVMALDEIGELGADAGPELRAAIEIATTALRELHVMFNDNRALSRAQRSRIALPELVERAASRAGVIVNGDVAACDLRVAVPAMVHAFALLFDQISGPRQKGRAIEIKSTSDGDRVTLTLSGPADVPATANEAIAIASFVVNRDDGALRCAPAHVTVELPVGPVSEAIKR